MELLCFFVWVKKKAWHKCMIYNGLMYNLTDNCNSTDFVSTVGIDQLDSYIKKENEIDSLHITNFSKDIQAIDHKTTSFSKIDKNVSLVIDGYTLSVLTKTLKASDCYRKHFIENWYKQFGIFQDTKTNYIPLIVVRLVPAKLDIIDYRWNDRLMTLAQERKELENAMYWLSTLGGAFSALGDEFEHCALMAGRISVGQLWLALRLGDPLTVARCKLFLALSLMQRGQLHAARKLVYQQYCIAKEAREIDPRLARMCQGVWAKLRYAYQLRHSKKSLRKTELKKIAP